MSLGWLLLRQLQPLGLLFKTGTVGSENSVRPVLLSEVAGSCEDRVLSSIAVWLGNGWHFSVLVPLMATFATMGLRSQKPTQVQYIRFCESKLGAHRCQATSEL